MLKHLILLLLFSGSLDGFSQSLDTTQALRQFDASKWGEVTRCSNGAQGVTGSVEWRLPVSTPDTLRAELLLTYTTRRWGVAHARDGYVVRKDGKVIRFLDDRKQRFGPNTRLWGWIVNEEKVRP